MDFKLELKKYTGIIDKELEKYIIKEDYPEKILNQSVEYSLMAGGKRLRPVLMISTYELFNNDFENCLPFAVAMEMIHNFSLIHDDLPAIDDDNFRHSKPSNHKAFNEATAILAGDSLLNKAYIVIANTIANSDGIQKERYIRGFMELSNSVDRMIIGEYIDTEYEGKQVSSQYLEYMNKNKTGALLKASARIGAIIAGAKEEEIEKISIYAEKIGLAFQIKDDILSEIGDEKILGKPVGNDKEKLKCTYVTKYGLKRSQEMLSTIIDQSIEQLKEYNQKGEFLKELAIYIDKRDK